MTLVNIEGLDRADVLVALFNASKAQGMSFTHFTPQEMRRDEAVLLLRCSDYFDYLRGRVMKVRLRENATEFDAYLYDRDVGDGAGERVIAQLRAQKETSGP
jgi:hypothetical protein